MASASRATRVAPSSKPMPTDSYSGELIVEPAPRPSSTRPPESASSARTSRATSAGWRKSLLSTSVPIRKAEVASAATPRAANGARHPSMRWSGTVSTENPEFSTSRASATHSSWPDRARTCTPNRNFFTDAQADTNWPDDQDVENTDAPFGTRRPPPRRCSVAAFCAGSVAADRQMWAVSALHGEEARVTMPGQHRSRRRPGRHFGADAQSRRLATSRMRRVYGRVWTVNIASASTPAAARSPRSATRASAASTSAWKVPYTREAHPGVSS